MFKYKKVKSEFDLIIKYIKPKNKTIIDAGCGSGYLTLKLADAGARVFGIDIPSEIKELKNIKQKNAFFKPGKSEKLPFENEFADTIIYYSSFHHVPENKMPKAVQECYRVLKPGGFAVFVEPSLEKGCYFELLRIVLDERKIQKTAYKTIKNIPEKGFVPVSEKCIYLTRTLNDFIEVLKKFIKNEKERKIKLKRGQSKIKKDILTHGKNSRIFHSTARINIFKKINA